MKAFHIYLSDADYAAFKAHSATRLYTHQRNNDGDTTIWTSKPYQLARDLERAIDFGATSAVEVLDLPPQPPRKTVYEIIAGYRR